MPAQKKEIQRIYRSLYRIRRVEEEIARVYPLDKIKSPVHLSIGQEAVSVGVCDALHPEDIASGTYRGHALYLAKGGDLKAMISELYGKANGCAQGKGGSMHLVDAAHGALGTSAVVGTTIPVATGYAFAIKYRKEKKVVTAFFGDGAVEEGVFAETINFAALKKLPIIYICENNQYAIHTHQKKRQAVPDIAARVKAYGIPVEKIAGNDVLKIRERVSRAVAAVRKTGTGPYFFECETYRYLEHVGPGDDIPLGYRTAKELSEWKKRDSLIKLKKVLGEKIASSIESEVEQEIREAFEHAERSPFPETSELIKGVLAADPPKAIELKSGAVSKETSFVDAIRQATVLSMEKDPNVFLYGLDVDDPKAILGTTRGLPETFGAGRCFGTPLSEDAMTGIGVGASWAGLRPIHVHIRMDFLFLAANQLLNMAAKSRYMFGGQHTSPMVVRAIVGKSWGQGAQHSQALHALFMHVPGMKIAAPTNPHDAKGCLLHATREKDPVLFIEHRLLYNQKGPVPESLYSIAPGKARVSAVGSDVTVVGILYMQIECLRARKYLEEKNISAEVIDPIWLNPLDLETILTSVRKTKKLFVVDNGWESCGVSAEIITRVLSALQGEMEIKVGRLGFAAATCPPTPGLESAYYPDGPRIASEIWDLVNAKSMNWTPTIRPELKDLEFRGPF